MMTDDIRSVRFFLKYFSCKYFSRFGDWDDSVKSSVKSSKSRPGTYLASNVVKKLLKNYWKFFFAKPCVDFIEKKMRKGQLFSPKPRSGFEFCREKNS